MREVFMPKETGSMVAGKCYLTHSNTVWRILEVGGGTITYVVRGKLAFPSWDKGSWRSASKKEFATEVNREVPCDWHGG
jgi:hypothetical protein